VKLTGPFEVLAEAAPEGPPAISYVWDFGDGVTAQGHSATHAYTINGEFTIKLTAEGLDGIPAARTFRIKVADALGPTPDSRQNRRYAEPAAR